MAKSMFVLIALALVAGSLAQKCGQPQVTPRANRVDDGGRIVGGVESKPNSLPWQISMQQYGSFHFCGGTVIRVSPTQEASDIVVTAAHCVYEGSSGITVVAGAHDLNSLGSSTQTVKVTKAVYHPQYDPDTTTNDIAILKLDKPIKFTSVVQPACLPAPTDSVADKADGTVSGWGATKEDGEGSKLLMQVGAAVINSATCNSLYKAYNMKIDSQTMLCAGTLAGGKDSCQGDSGGPYVVKSSNGTYFLQGVVSFGIGCARPNLPGVYARVPTYIPWINTQIKALSGLAG
jgi:transmembrane serine protease 3